MTGAEPAAVAGAAVAAKQIQEKLPGKTEKSFFAMSDKDKLEKIKEFGQERMNLMINDHADDFYNFQSEEVMNAELSGKRTTCIAEAIKAQTNHLLGFLMPGQVMMLLKEDKLESDLASMKTDLTNVLGQLSYYREENKSHKKEIKAVVETSSNLVRTMSDRSQEQINVIRQMQSDAVATKAEIEGLRREIYLLRETDRGQRPVQANQDPNDQANRDQSNGRGRGRGSSRGGRGYPAYGGPNGGQGRPDPWNLPHVTGTSAPFNPNCPSNKYHMDGQGKTPSQRREEESSGNGTSGVNDTGMAQSDSTQNNQGFQDQKKSRKNKGNKQPETVHMTKIQLRHAKEVVIHKVPSQKKGDYKDENEYKEKEADILYDLLEELTPKHLGDHGVVVNIKKDIDFMDRFEKHYDEENGGMAPIRVRFHTVRMCNRVLKAAIRAGCHKGRRPSDFGLYAIPKKYNSAGILNDKADEDAKRLADLRPAFYFRPSLPREERQEKEVERKKREEKKNDPEIREFRDRRRETLDKRVRFGNQRNFGQGEADKASEKSVQERENHLKEIREKKAAKKQEEIEREIAEEKRRLDNLSVTNGNFPLAGQGAGPGGPFGSLIQGQNGITPNGSFHSAKSSPIKEHTEPQS